MEKICLQPLGDVESRVLDRIAEIVEDRFGLPVETLNAMEVHAHAFNAGRGQYHSTELLRDLLRRMPDDALKILGITEVDLFVPQLNFVFGEATVDGRAGIISLRRLRPEYYGGTPSDRLFVERAVKEAVHELGHTFGMKHCQDPRCVMFFSNDIEDTDHKSTRFCANHAHQLAQKLRPLRKAA